MLTHIRLLKKSQFGKSVALFLLLCAVAWVGAASVSASEPVGKAGELKGSVFVEREGQTTAAKPGDPVFLRDKWQTKDNSSVEIVFLDESCVKMTSNTALEITEYLYSPSEKTRQGLLSMVSGKARFVVQDLQDYKEKRFRVQTQTAVVGTRDTDFIVRVRPESPRDNVCKEQLVEALCLENVIQAASRENPGKPAILTANMFSQVCGSNLPTPPRFATQAERAEMIRGVEEVSKGIKVPPAETRQGMGAGSPAGKLTTDNVTGQATVPPVVIPPDVRTLMTTTTSSSSTTTTTTTTTLPRTLPKPPPPPGPPGRDKL